jgi:hypothetical protein
MQEVGSEQFILNQLQTRNSLLVKELTAHLLYNPRSRYWLTGVRHWSPFWAKRLLPDSCQMIKSTGT